MDNNINITREAYMSDDCSVKSKIIIYNEDISLTLKSVDHILINRSSQTRLDFNVFYKGNIINTFYETYSFEEDESADNANIINITMDSDDDETFKGAKIALVNWQDRFGTTLSALSRIAIFGIGNNLVEVYQKFVITYYNNENIVIDIYTFFKEA